MRIIAGEYGGRRIKAPEGRGTRPTTDRTREALMSSVVSAFSGDLSAVRVLDAFAGTGAFGLEAISRGAAHATFFERDRRALAMLRENIASLAVPLGKVTVRGADVLKAPWERGAAEPFSLVFLDPPYALSSEEVCGLVAKLLTFGHLAPRAVVLYEHALGSFDLAGSVIAGAFSLIGEKSYGKTGVTLMRLAGGDGAGRHAEESGD